MIKRLSRLRRSVRRAAPLIHCLTNHISITDCANIILAVGAKPVMAEHPREVQDITRGADALLLNLGNINDTRMQSMQLSARTANEQHIPIILDLVGVGCSKLRLDFAADLIERFSPAILKGNLSEITALQRHVPISRGVDACESDLRAAPAVSAQMAKILASERDSVVVISGPTDIVATETQAYAVYNGHPMLRDVTGTGCMLGALAASFAHCATPLEAALAAVLLEGIAGELAAEDCEGIGSFKVKFFDTIYTLSGRDFQRYAKIERIPI